MDQKIKCTSLKYDGAVNYVWDVLFLEECTPKHVLVLGEPGRKLIHHKRGKTFTFDNPCIEYFPFDEWFTVAIEKVPYKEYFYYCNISMPPRFTDNNISYIDLDLDLIRRPGEDWQLVDEDEFDENTVKLSYPADLVAQARAAVANLYDLINNKRYPFDGWLTDKLEEAVKCRY